MTSPQNPLIAERVDSTTWYTGVGVAESIDLLIDGIKSESWVDGTLGGIGTVAEVAVWALDPVGALVSAGFAWTVEHVEPLSDALDWLAGDPDQIAANAQTWRDVGIEHTDIADRYDRAVRTEIVAWRGLAAGGYRRHAFGTVDLHASLAKAAEGMAVLVALSGSLVDMVRALVRDLIGEAIAILVARLPLWTIETVGSFGVAAPYVEAQVTALVAKWAAKITRLLRALIASLRNLMPALGKLDEIIQTIADLLRRRDSSGQPRPLVSGGVTRTRRPANSDYEALWQWAEDAYSNIRGTDDAIAISDNLAETPRLDGSVGFSPDEIQQIRQHVFFEEHLMDSYDGSPPQAQRFDPNEDMAEAWLRLRSGNSQPADIALLEHELAELKYFQQHPGATYQDAHRAANQVSNWESQIPASTREDFTKH